MAEEQPPSSGGGALQKKVMGLPTWGWIAIAGGVTVVGYLWWKSRQNAAASAASQSTTPTTGTDSTTGLATDQYEALLAQLRDLQGQNSQPSNTNVAAGVALAKRKDSPDNQDAIAYTPSETDWTVLLNNHYNNLPGSDPNDSSRHALSSILAHMNGQGGADSPKGKKIHLPQYLPYVGSPSTTTTSTS